MQLEAEVLVGYKLYDILFQIIDPWGSIIAECHDKPDVCVAEIDLALLNKRRLEMPVISHKRLDLYGQISPLSSGELLPSLQLAAIFTTLCQLAAICKTLCRLQCSIDELFAI